MIEYSGLEYHCAANDSFDSVALEIYGNETYAPDVMNANPEYCGKPVFDGGEVLRLPVLEVPEAIGDEREAAMASTTAPWKIQR